MKPQRIVQVLPSMRRAGAESVVANLCLGLADAGVEVHLVVIGNRYEYQESLAESAVRVHLLDLYQGTVRFYRRDIHWRIQQGLSRFFQALRPDVVHFHLAHAMIWGGVPAFRAGARCFYTAHGMDPDLLAAHPVSRYRRWLISRALRESHVQVLAVSASVAAHVGRGLNLFGVVVQPNPLGFEWVASPPSPAMVTPRRALMMGTLYPLKRMAVGIAACREWHKCGPCELWVAGEGPLREALQAQVVQEGLEERVTFLGVRRDPARVLAQVGVVWLLSEREGMPMVALESMAMGIPLIATDVPGIRELVRHEENGLLVPLDQPEAVALATERVWREPELRDRIVAGGWATIQRFHPAVVARDHLEHYQKRRDDPCCARD